jgi:signal transduction histidine kinase
MARLVPRRFASRSALVVVLLSLAAVATGVLSWEAVSAARRARATAERVLRDYAGFAAAQFVREAESRLEARFAASVSAARHLIEGHPWERPQPGGVRMMPRQPPDDCNCLPAQPVLTTFAVASSGVVFVTGEPLGEALVRELALAVSIATDRPRLRLRSTNERIVLSAAGHYRGEPVLLGIVAGESFLTEVFSRVAKEATLLPATLIDPAEARQLLGLRVIDGAGAERFASNAESSPFTANAMLATRFGGLRAEAAIPPKAASRLVIGGLPTERWPLVIGLLLLASGLVVAAAVQLRREIHFARQRADFVSGVSHELRTPLAQIRLFGETLLLGRVRSRDEEQRAAQIIVQEARRLSQMVDNVLLFSRASRGLGPLTREPVQPAALVMEIVEAFRPQAASKDASIVLATTGLTAEREMDQNAVRQMLLNLLDNAVKYGPRGQTVRVGVTSDATRVRLTVEDEGPGIAAEDRPKIWEPFWRASGSSEGGTGLGLAIVQELVTLHGGTATVEAGTAGGARFVLDLDAPVAAAHAAASPNHARQPA